MRILVRLVALAAFLALAPAIMAQGNGPNDKAYESSKAAELESVKLQLATRQDSRGFAEVTEVERPPISGPRSPPNLTRLWLGCILSRMG